MKLTKVLIISSMIFANLALASNSTLDVKYIKKLSYWESPSAVSDPIEIVSPLGRALVTITVHQNYLLNPKNQNNTPLNLKGCGEITQIAAGSSVTCLVSPKNSVTFSLTGPSSGTYIAK